MTKPNPEHKIDICHNGNVINVDYAGAINHARVHPEDIVPAFEDFPGPFPGQNIGESCSLVTTTTTQSTLPTTSLTTVTTAPIATTTTMLPTTSTTIVQETPTPTLVTTTLLAPTPTVAETSSTTAQVSEVVVPRPVVPETLPVTGIGTPGMIVVAGVLIAAGVKLLRMRKFHTDWNKR